MKGEQQPTRAEYSGEGAVTEKMVAGKPWHRLDVDALRTDHPLTGQPVNSPADRLKTIVIVQREGERGAESWVTDGVEETPEIEGGTFIERRVFECQRYNNRWKEIERETTIPGRELTITS